MVYLVSLGCTAKQFKEQFEVESIRDSLPPEVKACVLAMQRANTVYIEDGLSFEERKAKLEDLYKRKWHKRIVDENVLLEG